MPAVIADDGGDLKARKDGIFPRAIEDGSENEFVALVEVRKTAIGAEISVVYRAKVAIEVRGSVKRLAVGVVANKREIVAEALLDLNDAAFVESGSLRAVLIRLENPRIHKALEYSSAGARSGVCWVKRRI